MPLSIFAFHFIIPTIKRSDGGGGGKFLISKLLVFRSSLSYKNKIIFEAKSSARIAIVVGEFKKYSMLRDADKMITF